MLCMAVCGHQLDSPHSMMNDTSGCKALQLSALAEDAQKSLSRSAKAQGWPRAQWAWRLGRGAICIAVQCARSRAGLHAVHRYVTLTVFF